MYSARLSTCSAPSRALLPDSARKPRWTPLAPGSCWHNSDLTACAKKLKRRETILPFKEGESPSDSAAPREEIVTVRVTASGTVRAISSRVGQQVAQGQPLATCQPISDMIIINGYR